MYIIYTYIHTYIHIHIYIYIYRVNSSAFGAPPLCYRGCAFHRIVPGQVHYILCTYYVCIILIKLGREGVCCWWAMYIFIYVYIIYIHTSIHIQSRHWRTSTLRYKRYVTLLLRRVIPPPLGIWLQPGGCAQYKYRVHSSAFGAPPLCNKLAFTRYCHDQYCMVHDIKIRGSVGGRILRNGRAIVLQ